MRDDAKLQQSGGSSPWRRCRGPLLHAAVFSAAVNLLMLTGPIFMLQVYDRVLTSHSSATLAALLLIVTFLYIVLIGLDAVRARVLLGVGRLLRDGLDGRAFGAGLVTPGGSADMVRALRELDALQRALASPAAAAAMDLPWVPLFLLAIFGLHPALGWLALAGGCLLAGLSALQAQMTAAEAARSARASVRAEALAREFVGGQGVIAPLGMRAVARTRWQAAQDASLVALDRLAGRMSTFAALGRGARLYLQSVLLAAGAWLCLSGELTGGGMVAASVIFGRFLAPVEGVIAGWPQLARAWGAHRWLLSGPGQQVLPRPRLKLPTLTGRATLDEVTVRREGADRPALCGVSLSLRPGTITGLAGPSGSGKSTVLAVLAGLIPPDSGDMRHDGAAPSQYDPDALGAAMGFLPQEPLLFQATVAENIARLAARPDASAVIEAARRAGAHQLILDLPQGYDTLIGPAGRGLSGGQARRIALARALFGRPPILFLDEPDAGQDGATLAAIVRALVAHRAGGGMAVISSHHMRLLGLCDQVAVLREGQVLRIGAPGVVLSASGRDQVPLVLQHGVA